MVKCPRGTPSQIKANLNNLKLLEKISLETNLSANDDYDEKEEDKFSNSSEELELESYNTEKGSWSSKDELVQIFMENMLKILVKSWDSKPCYRPKLKRVVSTPSQSEEYGESDLLPCENNSTPFTTADYVNSLYKKRSSTLEKQNEVHGTKSVSESEEFEKNAEEETGDFDLPEWWKTEVKEEVDVVFFNGASYKGRVSKKLMEGEGSYFWEDGTSYEGEFVEGWATGKGRIEFPCQSVYEGEVYKGFRHGEGMHCLNESPVMYAGQWWLGKKHGEGMIVYNEPSKGHNFYRGQWQDGVKEGFGYRQYASGAKYIGFWSNGKRHGRGVMLWSNNDIYRGYWKEGIMHGYGEYTWNGFIDKTLSYPATNTYRGYWSEGKRHGRGTFETINDGIIDTVWDKDMKNGPGTVICANGTVITAEHLFSKDKQAPIDVDDDAAGLLYRDKVQRNKTSFQIDPNDKNLGKTKFISIPIHLSISSINLSHHIQKYRRHVEKLLEDLKPRPFPPSKRLNESTELSCKESQKESSVEESLEDKAEFSERTANEEKYLNQAIVSKIQKLKEVYNAYASLACDGPPPFKCLLLRLFLWQMLIDCNIPDSNLSLVDIDDLLAREDYLLVRSSHDPFEPIRLGQFILILLTLSWRLYARHLFFENPLIHEERVSKFLENYSNSDCKYVLKMAFNYFVENDLLTGYARRDWSKGEKTFTESDLAPMEAIYAIYRELGEPLSIRVFLEKMLVKKSAKNEDETLTLGNINNHGNVPKHVADAKNFLSAAGELAYIPGPAPFNFPEIMDADCDAVPCGTDHLFSNDLSFRNIMNCLKRSCFGIYADDFLVNMDYRLTFLEFYNAVISCIELNLKLNKLKAIKRELVEERKRKMKHEELAIKQERSRENRSVSNKRSRQVIDSSKKK